MLEARANVAEKKIHELNLKQENLQKKKEIGDEQKTRVRKAEHLLKVAGEEMLMAKLEAASVSEELVKVYGWWVPPGTESELKVKGGGFTVSCVQ